MRHFKHYIIALSLTCLIVFGFSHIKQRSSPPASPPASSSSPASSPTASPSIISATPISPQTISLLPDDYFYRQDDKAWRDNKIGDTKDSLYDYGCTITSVAMAVSNLTQQDITPAILESNLTAQDGFTDRGWLKWGKLHSATNGRVKASMFTSPDHRHIDRCIANGNYPIVKIFLKGTLQHWVMIIGTTETDYLIRDPRYGTADTPPITLQSRGKKIHSVRCVERAD